MTDLWNAPENQQQKSDAPKKDFKNIPDGRGRVGVVKETGLWENDKPGKNDAVYVGIYDHESNLKQRFFFNLDFSNQGAVASLKNLLKGLGLPIPADKLDIPKVLARAEGSEIKFDKWTKDGKWQNISVTEVLKKAAAEQPAAAVTDDECPF